MRDALRGQNEDLTRNERLALGEQINAAVSAKRTAATEALVEAILPYAARPPILREPGHELDAAHVAVLAELNKEGHLENAVNEVARRWHNRAQVSMRGPIAPYDFVVTPEA